MLARFNKESKIRHQWNIVITVQMDLALKLKTVRLKSNHNNFTLYCHLEL